MTDQIGFFDAIYTQRAIRHLKPDPVPRETIERLIRAGTKAPSGGNSQGWKFIVSKFAERLVHLHVGWRMQGVQTLRSVDRDVGNAALCLVFQVFVSH